MNNANHLLFFLFKVKTETAVDMDKENTMIKYVNSSPLSF
jgi:hypothetical protein